MREGHYDYMIRRMRELDDEIPAKYPQRKKIDYKYDEPKLLNDFKHFSHKNVEMTLVCSFDF